MIVGNPMLRSRTIDPKSPEGQSLTFRCFSANFGGNVGAPGSGPNDSVDLPKKQCAGGIRSNTYFPSLVSSLTSYVVIQFDDTTIQVLGWNKS